MLLPWRSEPVAVAQPQGLQALVLGGGVGIGDVLVVDRHAAVLAQPVTPLGIGVEQHAAAQLLVVLGGRDRAHQRQAGERLEVRQGIFLAVVDRGPDAQGEERAPAALDLPARVQVGLAGVAGQIDGGPQRRPDRAVQEIQRWAKHHLEVEVGAGGLLAVDGQGNIVCQGADLHFVEEAAPGGALLQGVHGSRRPGEKRPEKPECCSTHLAHRR